MATFDIQRFVDERRIAPVHLVVVALCGLIMFVDGLDVFIVGRIAPAIARSFGEAPKAMTTVILFQQIGLAIGAFVAAPLADRFGRKITLVIAASAFGLLTTAAVFSQSLLQLAILRGIAGLFLSAVLPMAVALVSEFSPKRSRAWLVALTFALYTTGSAAGGAIAAWLIDGFGWQSAFWIGGVLPLLLAPLMLWLLPESLQLLASRNPRHRAIAPTLRRLDSAVELTGDEHFMAGDGSARAEQAGLLDIFKEGRAPATLTLWLCFLLSMGNIALLANWMPTFFQEMSGVPIQKFAVTSMIAFAGGLVGTLSIGWFMDRIRPTRLIPVFYLGNAITLALLGTTSFGSTAFLAAFIAWNFFQSGGQAGINTYVAQAYPASMRSTGLGWAGGAGRIGGVIAPLFGGLALATEMSLPQTLMLIAIPAVAVGALLLTLGGRPRAAASVVA